jgi:GT2 family glycosyltransferase
MIKSEFPFVSIIIVNYNGANYLPPCLDALRLQTYPQERFEVIVSDNGSGDGSIELINNDYPWARLLDNGRNLGFASGNNVAIQIARGEFIILLNNDTLPTPSWLENMVKVALSDQQVGMVSGHLIMFYDQLELEIRTDTFSQEDDPRQLGVQVFDVASGVPKGIVQYLEGFYGQETLSSGKSFRWCEGSATLGIPVPHGSTEWSLSLVIAAPRPDNRAVNVGLFNQKELLATWAVSGGFPRPHQLTIPSDYRTRAKLLEQNTGSIIFRNGQSRDRGTKVRDSEVFFEDSIGCYSQIEEVFAGNGASLLLTKEMLDEVGMFDDDFFMYYEDTDLSWRTRLKGWKVLYAPDAVVRHIHCGTTKEWSRDFLYMTERNRLAMVFKNGQLSQVYRVWAGYALKVLMLCWDTFVLLLARNHSWRVQASQVKIHFKIIATLAKWFPSLWLKRQKTQREASVNPRELEKWFQT